MKVNPHENGKNLAYIWFKNDLYGQKYVRVMCSHWDKNIEPIFSENLKNMKKCLKLGNLRTSEPQKNLLVLIKKKVCKLSWCLLS